MTKDRLQINIRIDQEIKDWLATVPRGISVSGMIRKFLHSLMEQQGELTQNELN